MSKIQRFKRDTFPKKTAKQRLTFSWGAVSLYPDQNPRIAVIVSKKVFKKAVDRNRAKRRVYGVLESTTGSKQLKSSMVFYLKREALTAPTKTLEEDVSKAT